MKPRPKSQSAKPARGQIGGPFALTGPVPELPDANASGRRAKETVAKVPDDVAIMPRMVTREQLLKEIFEKSGLLNQEELLEIRRRIERMVFMHGRQEEEAKVMAVLANPKLRPPKFKDRKPGEDVVGFLMREFGSRGLLNGFLTRKILRDFDATCEAELSRFIRANGEVPDLNIPKAINFPDGDKIRSRVRDSTIS